MCAGWPDQKGYGRGDKAAAINSLTRGLAGIHQHFPPESAALRQVCYGDAEPRKNDGLDNDYLEPIPNTRRHRLMY